MNAGSVRTLLVLVQNGPRQDRSQMGHPQPSDAWSDQPPPTYISVQFATGREEHSKLLCTVLEHRALKMNERGLYVKWALTWQKAVGVGLEPEGTPPHHHQGCVE